MGNYFQQEIECAPREQILAMQNEKLVKQVQHVWEHVPYYRKKMEEAGINKRVMVDPDTGETLEYFDERDMPGYVEETEEEIDARHEQENRERKMNGIRCNLYKDKLQNAIGKVCKTNLDWLLVLTIINSDDVEEIFSEDFAKRWNSQLPLMGTTVGHSARIPGIAPDSAMLSVMMATCP